MRSSMRRWSSAIGARSRVPISGEAASANRDTLALHHEVVPFDAGEAQLLSDRAVDILRAADADELPPRIAAHPDFYLCRFCPYAARCWEASA
jgi:hypothetical protein